MRNILALAVILLLPSFAMAQLPLMYDPGLKPATHCFSYNAPMSCDGICTPQCKTQCPRPCPPQPCCPQPRPSCGPSIQPYPMPRPQQMMCGQPQMRSIPCNINTCGGILSLSRFRSGCFRTKAVYRQGGGYSVSTPFVTVNTYRPYYNTGYYGHGRCCPPVTPRYCTQPACPPQNDCHSCAKPHSHTYKHTHHYDGPHEHPIDNTPVPPPNGPVTIQPVPTTHSHPNPSVNIKDLQDIKPTPPPTPYPDVKTEQMPTLAPKIPEPELDDSSFLEGAIPIDAKAIVSKWSESKAVKEAENAVSTSGNEDFKAQLDKIVGQIQQRRQDMQDSVGKPSYVPKETMTETPVKMPSNVKFPPLGSSIPFSDPSEM